MASIELLSSWWGHEEKGEYLNYWRSGRHGDWKSSVGVETTFYNSSEKEIKYITFTYVPCNAVSDVITDVNGVSVVSEKFTGPIAPDTITTARFDGIWHDETIRSVKIKEISIDFMDNTNEVIPGTDVKKILNTPDEYISYCDIPGVSEVNYKVFLTRVSSVLQRLSRDPSKNVLDAMMQELNQTDILEIDYNLSTVFYQKHGEKLQATRTEINTKNKEQKVQEEAREKAWKQREKKKELAGKIGCFAATLIPIAIIVLIVCFAASLG